MLENTGYQISHTNFSEALLNSSTSSRSSAIFQFITRSTVVMHGKSLSMAIRAASISFLRFSFSIWLRRFCADDTEVSVLVDICEDAINSSLHMVDLDDVDELFEKTKLITSGLDAAAVFGPLYDRNIFPTLSVVCNRTDASGLEGSRFPLYCLTSQVKWNE